MATCLSGVYTVLDSLDDDSPQAVSALLCGDRLACKALSLMAFGSNSTKLDFSIICNGDGRAVGIPSNLKFL
ncbi:hypothetical protein DM01DRAFT_1372394 [Hesseltinella vesiculosa]|uniref:Uncharacterized protein n=1 Tax=Hesseltinella vesiculosa TaxID=101127 RepID=A0A1X2GMJ0_9FUNG|nr:hypothetical protein DM01DRAFT_1372394 [Hesseltinella vesiculosa]